MLHTSVCIESAPPALLAVYIAPAVQYNCQQSWEGTAEVKRCGEDATPLLHLLCFHRYANLLCTFGAHERRCNPPGHHTFAPQATFLTPAVHASLK